MSDITKCHGINCWQKDLCYRFTSAISEFNQSWEDFVAPIYPVSCNMLLTRGKPSKIKQRAAIEKAKFEAMKKRKPDITKYPYT